MSAALAAAAILVYRSGIEGAVVDRRARQGVPDLVERFAQKHRPALVLSIAELPQWRTDPVLVDTAGTWADSRQYCQPDAESDEGGAAKGRAWHENSICGGAEALAEDFFASPPFLHLSGRSYAWLAATIDPERFGASWLEKHKRYLHVSELGEAARRGVRLSAAEDLVSRLSPDEIRELVTGTRLAIAARRLFVERGPARDRTYRVYTVASFREFLETTPLSASRRRAGQACPAVVGSVCFEPNPERIARRIDQATALGGGAAAGLVLVVLLGAVRRARARRREQEARLFVLQTLSHEIRTPTTSLALSLEPIRRRFDDLPEEVQPAFLRLCDGVQRLERVVEASSRYLRGQLGDHEVRFDEVAIASANDFLLGLLGTYDREFAVTLLEPTAPVRLDPYTAQPGLGLRAVPDDTHRRHARPAAPSEDARIADRDRARHRLPLAATFHEGLTPH